MLGDFSLSPFLCIPLRAQHVHVVDTYVRGCNLDLSRVLKLGGKLISSQKLLTR